MTENTDIALLRNSPGKYTFTDFPPEIRNEIYIWALFIRDEEVVTQAPAGFTIPNATIDITERLRGRFLPFSTHLLQKSSAPFESANLHLWHRDPTLWQLNKQIRDEARSLHITKFLSVDLAYSTPHSTDRNAVIRCSLDMMDSWSRSRIPNNLRDATAKVEVRDWICAVPTESLEELTTPLYKGVTTERFTIQYVTAMEITVRDSGERLTVTTPLELLTSQAGKIRDLLPIFAMSAASRTPQTFDGRDIFASVNMLNSGLHDSSLNFSYRPDPSGGVVRERFCDRFSMIAKSGQVDWGTGTLLARGAKHVTLTLRMSKFQESARARSAKLETLDYWTQQDEYEAVLLAPWECCD